MAKYRDITSNEFQYVMLALINSKEITVSAGLTLMRINDEVLRHHKFYEEMRAKLVDKYGKKDAEGKVLVSEDKKSYVIEDRASFDKEFDELCEEEVVLSSIPWTSIENAKGIPPKLIPLIQRTIVTPGT